MIIYNQSISAKLIIKSEQLLDLLEKLFYVGLQARDLF